jgi:hypothetical protein
MTPYQYRMRLVIRHERLDLENISWVLRQITKYRVVRAGEVEDAPFGRKAKTSIWDGVLHEEDTLISDIVDPREQLTGIVEKLQAYRATFDALWQEGAKMQIRIETYSREPINFHLTPRLMTCAGTLKLEFVLQSYPYQV